MLFVTNAKKNLMMNRARRRIRSVPDPVLNQICEDLQERMGTDGAFVTFVSADRAYIVGATEKVPDEFKKQDGVALNSSFCSALVDSVQAESGIVSENTREEPMLKYCPTTAVYGSWVGAPVYFKNFIVGAIGVADSLPHQWRQDALSLVRAGAALVEAEIN